MDSQKLLRECREALHRNHGYMMGHYSAESRCPDCALIAKLDAALSASGGEASGAASVSSKGVPHELSVPAAVAVREALRAVLDCREGTAKAFLALENARNNYSGDISMYIGRHTEALLCESLAERHARDLLENHK